MLDSPWIAESVTEYHQDLILGFFFLGITFFSAYRIKKYFDPTGSGRIITLFYFLIFSASLLRSIWFLIPSSYLEMSYAPTPVFAFNTPGWLGFLVSQVLLVTGNLLIYSVFILVICYWAHMLRRVDSESLEPRNFLRSTKFDILDMNPLTLFLFTSGILVVIEICCILLFLFEIFNVGDMVVFDCLVMGVVSLLTFAAMTFFSQRIRAVLLTISEVNLMQSRVQVNRITAITIVANIFFLFRALLDFSAAFLIIWELSERKQRASSQLSPLVSPHTWDSYIGARHGSEVAVLLLELMISSAIKSYDVKSGHNPRRKLSRESIMNHNSQSLENIPLMPRKSSYDVSVGHDAIPNIDLESENRTLKAWVNGFYTENYLSELNSLDSLSTEHNVQPSNSYGSIPSNAVPEAKKEGLHEHIVISTSWNGLSLPSDTSRPSHGSSNNHHIVET